MRKMIKVMGMVTIVVMIILCATIKVKLDNQVALWQTTIERPDGTIWRGSYAEIDGDRGYVGSAEYEFGITGVVWTYYDANDGHKINLKDYDSWIEVLAY